MIIAGLLFASTFLNGKRMSTLPPPPAHIETFKEIAVLYDSGLADFYNELSPEERVFAYYLFRAGLPGNSITSDQTHRDALAIKQIFFTIFQHEDDLVKMHDDAGCPVSTINIQKFLQEAKTYLVYLWSNHSQYFAREHAQEKRTPERLGLTTVTKQHLSDVLTALGKDDLVKTLLSVGDSLFDRHYEPTATVPNSIEQSAVNIYAHDFTQQDYQNLTPEQRDKINAYFYVDTHDGQRVPKMAPYSVHGKYGKELSVTVFWLQKALSHCRTCPKVFDEHVVKSLELLIQFFQTGDEELFRQHSIQWLKTSSRIDYCFGFVETYHDPKSKRGQFQAEATIRTIDLATLNNMLPAIEQQLPFPQAFKRATLGTDAHTIPNASINTKIFGTGALGPMLITAAYCLPNYEDIRATYGSKQIIYPATKGLGAIINPALAHKLFYLSKEADWLEEHDADWSFNNDLWDIQCILHETLGHGSGKLAEHTFKEGDILTICAKTYAVGDTIPVTNENISEFLCGYEQAIEELRAEIIALYVSIANLDELLKAGFLTKWHNKIGKQELTRWLILNMANTGLKRIIQQSDDATEISGDHARANSTIMNYLINHDVLDLREETVSEKGQSYTVLGLTLVDGSKALEVITQLMQEVQRIKSTGDGQGAQQLIDTYGRKLNPRHLEILKTNERIVTGDLKARVYIAPRFIPIMNDQHEIVDVRAEWPKNIFEQFKEYAELEFCKE